jgi:hypothetical protein
MVIANTLVVKCDGIRVNLRDLRAICDGICVHLCDLWFAMGGCAYAFPTSSIQHRKKPGPKPGLFVFL